jgi:lysophospholipase L1-like esterase
MPHVVLLGDSIFDNAAYVGGGPDVVSHLRRVLPEGWSATLLAVDGSVTADVHRQLARIPAGASHLVLSVGGNDALGHFDVLGEAARSVAQVLDRLAQMGEEFDLEYRRLLSALQERRLPLVVCTIYEGALPDPALQRRAATALHVFNDAILRAAFEQGFPVVDLRLVCDSPGHYANPIEPSVEGGRRIAAAIAKALSGRSSGATPVYI